MSVYVSVCLCLVCLCVCVPSVNQAHSLNAYARKRSCANTRTHKRTHAQHTQTSAYYSRIWSTHRGWINSISRLSNCRPEVFLSVFLTCLSVSPSCPLPLPISVSLLKFLVWVSFSLSLSLTYSLTVSPRPSHLSLSLALHHHHSEHCPSTLCRSFHTFPLAPDPQCPTTHERLSLISRPVPSAPCSTSVFAGPSDLCVPTSLFA